MIITVAINYREGTDSPEIQIGGLVAGGEVTAIAIYDLFEYAEVAEHSLMEMDTDASNKTMDELNAIEMSYLGGKQENRNDRR